MLGDDMSHPGAAAPGVVLFESPKGGIQMAWDGDGGDRVTSVAPPSGANPASLPVYLMLQRVSISSYAGYYSYNGSGWLPVAEARVPAQPGHEDAGVFVASPGEVVPGAVSFAAFQVVAGSAPPHRWTAPPACFSLNCS